jgi:ATP-dependent DNA helicase RecG
MKMERIKKILQNGESITVEFKESKNKLNKDVFETVCAFLNRNGGELFLGVNDKGEVVGVDKEAIPQIKKDFATSMNNPQKMNPTFYLTAEEIEIDGKTILYTLCLCSRKLSSAQM